MEDPKKRLQIHVHHHHLRNRGRTIHALTSYSPVQLQMSFDGLQLALQLDDNTCTITPQNLSGCYKCSTGAEFHFACQTNFGHALADIKCQDGTRFTSNCSRKQSDYTAILPFEHPAIDTECQTECPAGKTGFRLKGLLHYIPLRQQSVFEIRDSETVESTGNSTCWSDFWDFNFDWTFSLWSLLSFKSLGIILLVIIVGLIGAFIFIQFSPIYRTWKLISWILVKPTPRRGRSYKYMAVIILVAARGSFGCASPSTLQIFDRGDRPPPTFQKFDIMMTSSDTKTTKISWAELKTTQMSWAEPRILNVKRSSAPFWAFKSRAFSSVHTPFSQQADTNQTTTTTTSVSEEMPVPFRQHPSRPWNKVRTATLPASPTAASATALHSASVHNNQRRRTEIIPSTMDTQLRTATFQPTENVRIRKTTDTVRIKTRTHGATRIQAGDHLNDGRTMNSRTMSSEKLPSP